MSETNNAQAQWGLFDDLPPDEMSEEGPSYPTWQWTNGNPQMSRNADISYTGGWFLPAEQAPAETLPGASPWTLITQEGTEIPGFQAMVLDVAMISYRRAWTVLMTSGRSQQFPWTRAGYETAKEFAADHNVNPRGKVQVLVGVKGLLDLGPFVLLAKGHCGKALTQIIKNTGKILKTPASALLRKAKMDKKHPGVPLRAFWIQIGFPYDRANDRPCFSTVGAEGKSSKVTLPSAYNIPEKPAKDWREISPFLASREELELFSAWYEEAIPWSQAWDELLITREHESEAGPISDTSEPSDDDLPF